jgi:hypothetical protein
MSRMNLNQRERRALKPNLQGSGHLRPSRILGQWASSPQQGAKRFTVDRALPPQADMARWTPSGIGPDLSEPEAPDRARYLD